MEKLKYINRYCSNCLKTQKYWRQRDGTYQCDLCGHKVYERDSPQPIKEG